MPVALVRIFLINIGKHIILLKSIYEYLTADDLAKYYYIQAMRNIWSYIQINGVKQMGSVLEIRVILSITAWVVSVINRISEGSLYIF